MSDDTALLETFLSTKGDKSILDHVDDDDYDYIGGPAMFAALQQDLHDSSLSPLPAGNSPAAYDALQQFKNEFESSPASTSTSPSATKLQAKKAHRRPPAPKAPGAATTKRVNLVLPASATPIASETKKDYETKYHALKQKVKYLVYAQEALMEDLHRVRRRVTQLSKEKTYLLDRLLQHEAIPSSPEVSSDEDDNPVPEAEQKIPLTITYTAPPIAATANGADLTLKASVRPAVKKRPHSAIKADGDGNPAPRRRPPSSGARKKPVAPISSTLIMPHNHSLLVDPLPEPVDIRMYLLR